MKIDELIGTPGAALLRATHAALPVRWGAGVSRPVELSTDRPRRFRGYADFPVFAGAQVCDTVRGNAMSGSLVLDGPDVKPAGVPLPIGKRSP